MARRIMKESEPTAAESVKQEGKGQGKPGIRKRLPVRPMLILLIAAFFLFAWYTTRGGEESFFKRLDQVKGAEEPYLILVLEKSTSLGEESIKDLEKLAGKAGDILEVFNVTYDPQDPSREAIYFIDNYGIESLPAVILVDSQGEVFRRYALPVSGDEVLEDASGLADNES